MAPRKQSQYEPQRRGWVVVRDMLGKLLWSADHSQGGAQEALLAKFDQLQTDGWTLEGRKFDMQFANRNGERVLIGIYPNDPLKPLPIHMVRVPIA